MEKYQESIYMQYYYEGLERGVLKKLIILKSSFLVLVAVLQIKFGIWLEFFLAGV